ncbi:MAG: hypothetical protein BA867_02975 [Desulfobacterales bacterium S5133MH16]|nr:MAG: hypothetical protein BA867_02975 [Desulfobacterales bacterium S5133MH16]
MGMKPFLVTKILPFVIGALILISFSALQKIIIGANPFMIKGYVIPFIFGGASGIIIAFFRKKWEKEAVRVETEKLQAIIEMAAAVCHELNQPLQSISGYCELLMMDLEEGDQSYKQIKGIKGQVDRAGKITKKLMRVKRYETKDYLKGKIIDIDRATE